MTTTERFQINPDFYTSIEECQQHTEKKQTNNRYKNFKQTHFTAGDVEQFMQYHDSTNGDICREVDIDTDNLFKDLPYDLWDGFKDITSIDVINTFLYIFYKFKKSIYVKIQNNKLKVFLPFSNANYVNEWSGRIKIEEKYGTVTSFLRYISEMEGRHFDPQRVNGNLNEWVGNNCLVRYEYPVGEGDTNVSNNKNFLEELCANRKVPDIEFFINRRDFPILTRDYTEPYNHLFGSDKIPLLSHSYKKFAPIFIMSNTDKFADILMPTWEDWMRVQSKEGKYFKKGCREYIDTFPTKWEDKKPTAVFRGSTTGCGVDINTNPRLKVCAISKTTPPDENGVPYLDAGISKWNLRPRMLQGEKYLRTIDIKSLPFSKANELSPQEQSKNYKYVINIDGHVTAYRLSLELSMNVVVLLVKSKWKIWYSDMLVPYKHYVPVKEDMSDLIQQIKWCRTHDNECKQIAINARQFYDRYLQKEGIFDYMQKQLVNVKKHIGVYLYNVKSPMELQLQHELSMLSYTNHGDIGTVSNIIFPKRRIYGSLGGINMLIETMLSTGKFYNFATKKTELFKNNSGVVNEYSIGAYQLVIKSSSDVSKSKEHIHEAFLGKHAVNPLLKLIPNFAYIYGLIRDGDTSNLIAEKINGITLLDYIRSNKFIIKDFVFIFMQICLALSVAQQQCAFTHYDLTPWNIMIQQIPNASVEFDYLLNYNLIYRVKTSMIPIIIDYGKSYATVNNNHHGLVNMYRASTCQDILSLLLFSVLEIIENRHLENQEIQIILYLMNFISGTEYRKEKFNNLKDIKDFIKKAKRYTELTTGPKYDLENKTPLDMFNYIKDIQKFNVEKVGVYNNRMNSGNSRQVFDYIISPTPREKINSFYRAFNRISKECLPNTDCSILAYFCAQNILNSLSSMNNQLTEICKSNNIEYNQKEYEKAVERINTMYGWVLHGNAEGIFTYPNLDNMFNSVEECPYNSLSFLNNDSILEIVKRYKPYKDVYENIGDVRNLIIYTLCGTGPYKIKQSDINIYLERYKDILKMNSVAAYNNVANIQTIFNVAKEVYTLNLDAIDKNECSVAKKFSRVYRDILFSM